MEQNVVGKKLFFNNIFIKTYAFSHNLFFDLWLIVVVGDRDRNKAILKTFKAFGQQSAMPEQFFLMKIYEQPFIATFDYN